MNYKILVDNKDVNDATSFYLNIISTAVKKAGFSIKMINSISDLATSDIAIIVKVTTAFRVLRKNPKQRIILWLQGVQPEEMMMSDNIFYKKIFFYLSLRFLESLSFRNIPFMIYVSNEMKRHYERKFGVSDDRMSFIMPCYNLELDKTSFTEEKYINPSFVYAGSLDNWQCFEKTLETFSHVKKQIPDATLTLLTKETEKAKRMVGKYLLKNVTVKYIPKEQVQAELQKYKYGFILREDVIVNRVATPTKLNSYLASGVIPIVSECLIDFINNTTQCQYICRIKNGLSPEQIAESIIAFDKCRIYKNEILKAYEIIFDDYYNSDKYINELSIMINKYNDYLTSH